MNQAFAAELGKGPQEFGVDYNAYENRKTLAEIKQLMRKKQYEKLALQRQQERQALEEQRKATRLAQIARGELRDIPVEDIRVVQTLTGNFTAYTPSVDECDGDPWRTASGTTLHYGTIAAPPQYAFGTLIRLPDYDPDMIFRVEDRGGAIKGNHFDIALLSKKEAFAFGRRPLKVEIIEIASVSQ